MTATLTVRVKNETRQDIAGIVDGLDEAKGAAEGLGESLADSAREASVEVARLSKEQSHEIKVIHEQRAAWSSLAATAIPALGSITTAGLGYAATLAKISAASKVMETALVPVLASQRAINSLIGLGEKAALRGAASWAGYGAAAGAALTTVAALKAGVFAVETVLANTGKTAKGTMRDFTSQTAEQILAYDKIAAAAKDAGIDIETAMQAAGHTWEEFGVKVIPKVETNLNRVQNAAELLKSDMAAFGDGAVTAAKEAAAEVGRLIVKHDPLIHAISEALPAAYKKFDAAGTQMANNLIQGMERIGESIRGVDRDAVKAATSLAQLQKKTVDDFARVRISENQARVASEARAEAARVAGLATANAVDSAIAKLKEQRGIQAANDKFDEAAQKKYLSDLERLESRRSQLLDQRKRDEEAERTKRVAEEKKASEEIIRLSGQAYEARNKAILKENADHEKALDDEVKAIIRQGQEQQKIAAQVTANQQKEHTARQQAYVAKWRETVDRIAAIINGKSEGGGALDQIRAGISQRDVARQVGDNRAAAAEREFRESGEGKRREDALMARGVDRDQAERRVLAQQRALRDQARARGFADTMRGRNGDEATNAQSQLIQATAQQAAASGELAPVVAQGLQQAARQAIQATRDAQQAKAVAIQVLNALNANGQRMRSINGSLK